MAWLHFLFCRLRHVPPNSSSNSITINSEPVTVVLGTLFNTELSCLAFIAECRRASIICIVRVPHVDILFLVITTNHSLCASVLSHFNFCNTICESLPASTLAHVVLNLPQATHPCSPALQALHWLSITVKADYRLSSLLVHNTLCGHMPAYITDLLTPAANIMSLHLYG